METAAAFSALNDVITTSNVITPGDAMRGLNASTSLPEVSTIAALLPVELAQQFDILRVALRVHRYWLGSVLLLGIIGNSISLAVMVQPHNRSITMGRYLAALAVSDNLFLIGGIHFWLRTGLAGNFVSAECKFMDYVVPFSSTNSAWLVVAMTVDRSVAIVRPFSTSSWRRPEGSKYVMLLIAGLSAIWNIPYVFTASIVDGQCTIISGKVFWHKIFSWAGVCINSLVPFFSLVAMNALIIHSVRKSKKFSRQCTPAEQVERVRGERDRQLVRTLLLVTSAFLVLTIALPVRSILFSFWDWSATGRSYAIAQAIYHLSHLMYFTNGAVNFFLYCIGGSKFRKDAINLFTQCLCRRKMSASSQSSSLSASSSTVSVVKRSPAPE